MSESEAAPVRIADVSIDRLAAEQRDLPSPALREVVFDVKGLGVTYNGVPALQGVSLEIYRNFVTAFIGPSGCGKSTFIRCFNHLNDLIPGAKIQGKILYHEQDLYGPAVDPVEVRKRIGMVFQKPNPFPKSIYDNVAFGPRVLGWKKGLDERVEQALRHAALWDEVKNRLKASAYSLSGGQQQRLCIARCLAVEPDVILMDLFMPGTDGLAAIGRIRAADPEARILVLTSFASADQVVPAVRAGAAGYLLKTEPPERLVEFLRAVAQGEAALSGTVARRLLERIAGGDEAALRRGRAVSGWRVLAVHVPEVHGRAARLRAAFHGRGRRPREADQRRLAQEENRVDWQHQP